MASKSSKQKAPEPTFTVERLIASSEQLLGKPRHVAVGAFNSVSPTEEFTKDEAKQLVDEWLSGDAS